jgi:transposase
VCSTFWTNADEQFEALVESDPTIKRLTTLPGIGPITASAFVAALHVVNRFERAGQVTSYLGLVPQEYSSGETQRRGRLVRSAYPHLQSLLVQAAWRMWRMAAPRTAQLRAWAHAIARRRGKKVATVALARRLAASCSRCGETRPTINRSAFERGIRKATPRRAAH